MPALKLLHIAGARPQFAKVAAVSRAAQAATQAGTAAIDERVLHTGQHYDYEMSEIFFSELGLRRPDYNLEVGSGTPAYQTAAALEGIFSTLGEWNPDRVLVYGDTNTTLAGALATLQRRLPLGHVEAGVRTGVLHQAEELNRAVADRIATWRFCCTELNMANLASERLAENSYLTGDTLLDNYRMFLPRMDPSILSSLGLETGKYVLATIHRAENTDYPERLQAICSALIQAQREFMPVVFPCHPRTRKELIALDLLGSLQSVGVKVIEPTGFHTTQALLEHSHCTFSDSGGLLRESYFAGRFCVIPWEYAAWPELVETGWASTGPVEQQALVARLFETPAPKPPAASGLFGDGQAGEKIISLLLAT